MFPKGTFRFAILLVDDERLVLQTLGTILVRAGYAVTTVQSAEEALDKLKTDAFDLIISDYSLQGMNGTELLKTVMEKYPDTQRILFTGQKDAHIAEEAIEKADIFRFLLKPVSSENLLDCINDAVIYSNSLLEERTKRLAIEKTLESQKQEIESSKSLLAGVLEVLPFGVLAVGADETVFMANPAAHTLLGYTGISLVGMSTEEIGVPKTMSGGEHPLDWVTAAGRQVNLLWEKNEIGGGRTVYSIVDVTKRTKLERMVFQGKKEIEAVFDSITDPIYLINRKKIVIRCNHAFARLVNRTYAEIIGATCNTLLDNLGPDCEKCAMKKSFQDGLPRQREWNDRSGAIYRTHLFPVLEKTKVIGAVIRLQDITEDKEKEFQLVQSEKMASLGQLSAGIAHEINNPVGFIISGLNRLTEYSGVLSAIRKKAVELGSSATDENSCKVNWEEYERITAENDCDFIVSEIGEIVGECREGAERIRKIAQDLKTFSHPDQGNMESVDINECLNSTLNLVWNELKYKCELIKDFGQLPPLLCHSSQLNQVFVNLLVNAAQAIKEHGVITVRTRYDSAINSIKVEIVDTGVGIPKQSLIKIFDPFFTTKKVGQGTGLGLHLSLNIVRGHGGDILVRSEPDRNTTFTVVLPVGGPESAQPR